MSVKINMCDIEGLKQKVEPFLNDNPGNNIHRIETLNSDSQNEKIKAKKNSSTKKLNSNLIYLTGTSQNNINQYTSPNTKCINLNETDLKILLHNFYKLEGEEQQILISYLKKLETKNPELVNKVKEFARVTPPLSENDINELEILDELDDILQDIEKVKESDNPIAKLEETNTEQAKYNTETMIEKQESKEGKESIQEETVKEVETKNDSQEKKAKTEISVPITNAKNKKKTKKKVYKVPRKRMYHWAQSAYRYDLDYYYRECYRHDYETFNMPAYYHRNYYPFPDHYYY